MLEIFKTWRFWTWIVLVNFYISSANPGSEKISSVLLNTQSEISCVLDSGKKLILKTPNSNKPYHKRTLKIVDVEGKIINQKSLDCSIVEDSYYCDWGAYYTVSIKKSDIWKPQQGLGKSNTIYTGFFQNGFNEDSEKIFCKNL